MRFGIRLTTIFLLLESAPALAWGLEGHQIVAAIAARELTPIARAEVSSLLGGEADVMMVLEASWADDIRHQRPQTQSWHYVNIELGSRGYVAARDCPDDNCVVAQIDHDASVLVDPRAPRQAKTQALLFLIHFVGDVHQPLHAADHNDRGGNEQKVRLGSKHLNLHEVWDQDVVTAMGYDSERIAGDIEAHLTPRQKAQIESGTPADWANESFMLAARVIYAALPASGSITLPPDYPRRENGVVREQLTKAGLRLAMMLNRIFG